MPLSKEFVEQVRKRVADDPGVRTEQLAVELDAPESQVIMALPLDMRLRARTSDFEAIWAGAAGWERALLSPAGRTGDAERPSALPGKHFLQDQLGFIWFVSNPRSSGESPSIRFFDKQGGHMLSIYLGLDAAGRLAAGDKAEYEDMRKRFGVVPAPRMHCKGCGNCTCGGKKHAH